VWSFGGFLIEPDAEDTIVESFSNKKVAGRIEADGPRPSYAIHHYRKLATIPL